MKGQAVPFADERRKTFLELFEPKDRSTMTNLFLDVVRGGASSVEAICGQVAEELSVRVREEDPRWPSRWPLRKEIYFANHRAAWAFAEYAIAYVAGNVAKSTSEPEHDSHLEDLFSATWARYLVGNNRHGLSLELTAQHRVGIYRIDFALVALRIAVELDGHDYHKTIEQRCHDAAKGRYLTMLGWLVFRFTGHEVHADPDGCAAELYRLAVRRGAFDLPYEPIARRPA